MAKHNSERNKNHALASYYAACRQSWTLFGFFIKTYWTCNLLRRRDYPEGRFTLAFVGYGDEADHTVLELTHNWDTESYDLGDAYGHIAIEVDDAYAACERVKEMGGKVVREAGPMKHGTTVIAFVEDPDGYKIEFIQKKSGSDSVQYSS